MVLVIYRILVYYVLDTLSRQLLIAGEAKVSTITAIKGARI